MDYDVIIIGGGVVGLACAVESVRRKYSTLLIERHESFGQETSSRNSEVIHSGIYYTPGSLKAELCLAGNRAMYSECERLGVWYQRCGKLIVAVSSEEEPELEKIYARGNINGVEGLELFNEHQVKRLEPNIVCRSAIFVPSTGIVDTHELMKAFLIEARSGGADCLFGIEFLGVADINTGYLLEFRDTTGETIRMSSRFVINAAGLNADRVAELFGIDSDRAGYRLLFNRGHYYRISASRSKMISRLVYPVPNPQLDGLGVHITIDRAGQVKLGPDNEYIDRTSPVNEWYKFDDSRRGKFYDAVSRYFPSLQRDELQPDQVGVRPKIQKPGEPMQDFIIMEESKRGLPGLLNLIGIESPGLTSSIEIARNAFTQLHSLN
jgi:L-2-hydroxyglutarate oxidase LhgO